MGLCTQRPSSCDPLSLAAPCRPTSSRQPGSVGSAGLLTHLPLPQPCPRISLAQNELADRRRWARGVRGARLPWGGRGAGLPWCRGRPMAGRLAGVCHLPVARHVGAGGHHRAPGQAALVLLVIRAGACSVGAAVRGLSSDAAGLGSSGQGYQQRRHVIGALLPQSSGKLEHPGSLHSSRKCSSPHLS